MKQEDKELLLRDLCARLPYGVKCNVGEKIPYTLCRIEIDNVNGHLLDFIETKDGLDMQVYLSEVKPYLFPLSSMTEEQREEYDKMSELDIEYTITQIKNDSLIWTTGLNRFNWLLKNHFDIGLIPMGLAIDATNLNIY